MKFICAIEWSQRARITRPIARNANIVPAPGTVTARVGRVLAKALLLMSLS
ncbi:MAG: hypothetical protein PW999_25860 [Paraburkholderia tropica]|nr:hypothetical protein [Paraburkholderia tropica]